MGLFQYICQGLSNAASVLDSGSAALHSGAAGSQGPATAVNL